jgi:hypothetical protein
MSYVATTMPVSLYRPRYRGMGDAASTGRIVGTVGNLASGAVPGILAAHAASVAAAAGLPATSASVLGMSLGVAVPVIGAALVGATMLAGYLISNSGCGQTCIVTSQWANQAEDALKRNLAAYMALPSPRTPAQQQVALANFDAIWGTLQQQCGQPSVGNAGVRCISDRQAGACKWRDSSGQCFNWFSGYRDPIANDPVVSPAPLSLPGSVSDFTSTLGIQPGGSASSLLPLALIAGLVIWAVA